MSNRLAHEQSPYLLQHKNNPVDWYPWSEEAFETARREDRPIFLSIGYSTCHWCHVMAHESFEDDEVASLMNEVFVSIKVDREERPDIDGVYMTACQLMSGQGGWPLTVIMTPEKEPFHIATYIPKSSRFGRPGMIDLIPRIKDVWANRREEVLKTAGQITASLRQISRAETSGPIPSEAALDDAYRSLKDRFDPTYGGFGSAPKFPSPHNLMFLLRYWRRSGESSALDMVVATLEQMRLGGIFDQIGFGFHRYSTDRTWLLPHFEKMLYDQALLAMAYTEAYQATGREEFRETTEEILEYALRDMHAPEGAFYSAEDADSEGKEGTFYVWSVDEIREALPPDLADYVIAAYHLSPEGNFEEEATRQRTGENVLHLRDPALHSDERLRNAREILFEFREKRIRPGRDDKILTDWNGLMIAALSKASSAFDDARYLDEARRAALFLLSEMRTRDGKLLHRYRGGDASVPGMLDDYAYLIWGLLELYEAGFETQFLKTSLELQDDQIKYFWDEEGNGFFFTSRNAEALLMRQKEFYDGALPSGNAVSFSNLLRLARMTGRTPYEERAEALSQAVGAGLERMPSGFTALLSGLTFALGPSLEIIVAGERGTEETGEFLRVIRTGFRPNKVLLFNVVGEDDELAEIAPFVESQMTRNGRAAVYLCRNFACEMPISDVDTLATTLNSDS